MFADLRQKNTASAASTPMTTLSDSPARLRPSTRMAAASAPAPVIPAVAAIWIVLKPVAMR
jgi:hypothetical protein